jgi:hypothetical protein
MFSFPFSSHMITIDSSHLSQIDLAHGLSTAELDSVSDRIPEYLQKIHARNQGFYSDDVLCNDLLEKEIQDFADSVKGKYDHIVLLGIGGSSLGPIALREALSSPFKKEGDTPCQYPKLIVLDNIDPDFLAEAESQIELSRTLFWRSVNLVVRPRRFLNTFIFEKDPECGAQYLGPYGVCDRSGQKLFAGRIRKNRHPHVPHSAECGREVFCAYLCWAFAGRPSGDGYYQTFGGRTKNARVVFVGIVQ